MGSISNRYMCILLYVKCIWCRDIALIYGQMEEGVRLVCHG